MAGPFDSQSVQLSETKRRVLAQYLQGKTSSGSKSHLGFRQAQTGARQGERSFEARLSHVPGSSDASTAPLSFGQRPIWLHSHVAAGVPLYNEPWTVHFQDRLDVPALERAINEFVRRHEAWRTVFPMQDGGPVQQVQEPRELTLHTTDVRDAGPDREREATRLAELDARAPFDLTEGPLLRVRLVTFADDSYRLYLTLHHLIFDGFAIYRIFLAEIAELYDAFRQRLPSPLPQPAIQHRDYAWWQLTHWRDGKRKSHLEYWREQLGNKPPVLQLPTTFLRPPEQTFAGAMCRVSIPGELRDTLRCLGAHQGATLFMVLLAAFDLQLYAYSGQEEFLVGSVTAGRNHPDLQKLVGYCLNTIVLRADLRGEPTFRELLGRVRENTLGALAHDEVPLDELLRELHPERDPARNPLYDVMFSLEPPLAAVDMRWNLTQVEVETGAAKVDLYFELDERPGGITGKLMYKTSLFSPETANEFVEDYIGTLRTIADNPDIRVSNMRRSTGAHGIDAPRPQEVRAAPEPSNAELETVLLTIWRSVLRTTSLGPQDNFFYSGGHSLRAIQLLAGVEQQFAARLYFSDLLQAPTVREFANVLRRRIGNSAEPRHIL